MIVWLLKPNLFIPPVIALAIAGTWLGSQHRSISTLERQSDVLRKAIATRSSGGAVDSLEAKSAPAPKGAQNKEPIDWKQIAGQFMETRRTGGMSDMRATMRFQQRLQALSKEELVTALDEIAALDFPAKTRIMLENMILGPLVEKDPELALTRFIDRLQDNNGSLSWQLSNAMQQWAEKDPAAAIAWFDKQIAAGKFDSKSLDGKSRSRIEFEGGFVRILLGSDPAAAGRRLAAMPEDQRGDVLSQSFQQLKDEEQPAFAALVRDQLSKEDQALALAQQASRLVGKDEFAKVTGFLDRIQASRAERSACVQHAAESSIRTISHQGKVTREDLDTMREWVIAQAPESTGRVTGSAIANAMQGSHKLEFSEAADLAVQYHETCDNDDVLYSFLDSWPGRQNKEQARVLAEKISDAKRREEILQNLQ